MKVKFDQFLGGVKSVYRQFTFVIALALTLSEIPSNLNMFFSGRTYSRLLYATDGKTNSISRLLFNSNRAAVIRNQILIRTSIGPFINNTRDS